MTIITQHSGVGPADGETMTPAANYSLRDQIRDYWSTRAETFDLSPGHEIFCEDERRAWHALILKHLGKGEGRRALDLACGTGVVSHLMHDLGFDVTGLDWSESMLDKARAKAKKRSAAIRFLQRDAERTLEDRESCDVIVTRHLVWTLVDPAAAFAEWHELLKPGGRLLVIDGDFVAQTWFRLMRTLARKALAAVSRQPPEPTAEFQKAYKSIQDQLYFDNGARAKDVVRLLVEAGFEPVIVDQRLRAIHRAQGRHMPLAQYLDRTTQHRYAICAVKPA
jgi:ubiquinone/menaquinone biosynthesis C-methylase UbiE